MSDVNYRELFPGDGFANFEYVKGISAGWKRIAELEVGSSALMNLKVKGSNKCSQLLTFGVHSDEDAHLTCLSNNGPFPADDRPLLRITKGGGLADGKMALEVNYGEEVNTLIEWTDQAEDNKVVLMEPSPPDFAPEVICSLTLGENRGIQTSSTLVINGNEVYHAGNLPPIASSGEILDGGKNDVFVTPAALKPTLDELTSGNLNVILKPTHTLKKSHINVILTHGEFALPGGDDCELTVKVDSSVDLDKGDVGFLPPVGEKLNQGGEKWERARIKVPSLEFRFIRINGEWFL